MASKKQVRAAKPKEFSSLTVKQVMEKRVQSVHLRTKGDVIASLMIEGFGAVPVIDKNRKLTGIVSEHDLLSDQPPARPRPLRLRERLEEPGRLVRAEQAPPGIVRSRVVAGPDPLVATVEPRVEHDEVDEPSIGPFFP